MRFLDVCFCDDEMSKSHKTTTRERKKKKKQKREKKSRKETLPVSQRREHMNRQLMKDEQFLEK